jgi:hypothetical protein
VYSDNERDHLGASTNLKPWAITNQHAKEKHSTSDHVVLASTNRVTPVTLDKPVPWLQGIMVITQAQSARLLGIMSYRYHQHLGAHQKLNL